MTIHDVESIEFDGASFVIELEHQGDTESLFVATELPMTVMRVTDTNGKDHINIVIDL